MAYTTEYLVVDSPDIQKLVNKVGELLNDGWELQGGIAMDNWKGWAQAMVKHASEGD